MSDDSVLPEVRSAREAFARSHGFDIRARVADLPARDDLGDWSVVRLAPRDPSLTRHRRTPDPVRLRSLAFLQEK